MLKFHRQIGQGIAIYIEGVEKPICFISIGEIDENHDQKRNFKNKSVQLITYPDKSVRIEHLDEFFWKAFDKQK